ncbi:unnamed protein product [Lactuca saligna]|uniref:Uncharacterized protein n=1 Tax=Lactuca saligna TaxID=75948 RepID=A0AA35Y756_LACSI|nr:unnamed protein product [Lactuca saligna]
MRGLEPKKDGQDPPSISADIHDVRPPKERRRKFSGGEAVEALDGEGAAFLVVYGSTATTTSPNSNHCCFVRLVSVVNHVQLEARSRLVLVAHGVAGNRW